jgi:hypothetical protein
LTTGSTRHLTQKNQLFAESQIFAESMEKVG